MQTTRICTCVNTTIHYKYGNIANHLKTGKKVLRAQKIVPLLTLVAKKSLLERKRKAKSIGAAITSLEYGN